MDDCTCDLEDDFSTFDESAYASAPFGVIDAECEVVATCKSFAYAKLVAWALNKATDKAAHRCCVIHSENWATTAGFIASRKAEGLTYSQMLDVLSAAWGEPRPTTVPK